MKNNFFSHPQKQSVFPRISRLFTVHPIFWTFIGLLVGILASIHLFFQPVFVGALTDRIMAATQRIDPKRALLMKEYEYWLGVTKQKPDYRDAYLLAGKKAQELGLGDESIVLIEKAKSLDPTLNNIGE